MITRGQRIVISVRAQALADELRNASTLGQLGGLMGGGARRDGLYLNGPDVSWAAQRLLSACERALGTRGRHYD